MRATASAEEIKRFHIQKGDVIITKDSEEWRDIGVPAYVEYAAPDLVCGYHLAILRPRSELAGGEYLLNALQSQGVSMQYYLSANGVTRYGLSHNAIKSVVVPIPPLHEQHAIVDFLKESTTNIVSAIDRANHEITYLREYRIRLFADVVTGKLDVRSAAVGLSEEVTELPGVEEILGESESMLDETENEAVEATDADD